ncbi:MAG: AhpC/TSA family protein [Xanthomonadaceae bacterium]|nr:AhpC/TSA family protein [Xanthomonadaceae bacterium]
MTLGLGGGPVLAEIHPAAEQVRPLLPGMSVPIFEVLDFKGEKINVEAAKLNKAVVLTFYRGGWCPYCNMHLAELRTAEAELRELGFDVWFISPDKPELLAEGDHSDYGYTLLSDPKMNAAQAFGIAFRINDEDYQQYVGFGLDLNDRSGDDHQALPAPASFIVGEDGKVQFSYVNPDYTVRLAPEVLLAAARTALGAVGRRFESCHPDQVSLRSDAASRQGALRARVRSTRFNAPVAQADRASAF